MTWSEAAGPAMAPTTPSTFRPRLLIVRPSVPIPTRVVPWFDPATLTTVFTLFLVGSAGLAPPSKRRYWRVTSPPWEWPTISTCAEPVAVRTASMYVAISFALDATDAVPRSDGRLPTMLGSLSP